MNPPGEFLLSYPSKKATPVVGAMTERGHLALKRDSTASCICEQMKIKCTLTIMNFIKQQQINHELHPC